MSAEKRRGPRRDGGDPLENEFRAMFAERSETVRVTTAPYAAVRQRIAGARRKRRLRIGGAGVAFAVAVAGIGAWAADSGGVRHQAVVPATTPHPGVTRSVDVVYSDGHTPIPAGPLRDAAVKWLRTRYSGDLIGATVVTTFDRAEQVVADTRARPGNGLDAGTAVLDWHTGDVLALGGTWDRPAPIADLMKPVVLAAAFETGLYTPQSKEPLDTQKHPILWPAGAGEPLAYYNVGTRHYWPPESSTTSIENVDVTLTQAAESGANGPFAQLELGPGMALPTIMDLATRLGLPKDSPDLNRVPSLVLGVAEATPLTMAGVYATIADGGVRQDPRMVAKVVGKDSRTLWTPPQSATRVISQNTATQLTGVLHAALTSGTTGTAVEARTSARADTWAMAAAPDTQKSAWFDGADGRYVIAVGLTKVNPDGSPAPLSGDLSQSGPAVGSARTGPIWDDLAQTLRNHG